jgi:EAL domain-containing protein (putative c-di-GMP-specific phosphodiesterase class I)/GGDEF domain-containing protein
MRIVLTTVVTSAAIIAGWSVAEAVPFLPGAPAGFWAMALGAMIADLALSAIARREESPIRSTLSVCYTFAIFALWGAAPAVLVQTVASAISVTGQRYQRTVGLFTAARLICATAAAVFVVTVTGLGPVSEQGAGLDGGDLVVFVVLATVWLAANLALLLAAWATLPSQRRPATLDTRVDLASTATAVLVVSPLLTTVAGWWPLLIVAALLVWNRLALVHLVRQRRMVREPVSGLLNRQGMAEGMRAITAADLSTPGGQRSFGIVLVSFESVMEINRILGREIYEKVVAVASRRLIDTYGKDRAARLSGEGLVILFPDLTEANALAETESAVSVLEPVVEVDDIPFALDPVGGVALSPRHGQDIGTLLMKAELAAGEARRTGRRAVRYVRQAAELAERRVELLRELHSTLRDPARHEEFAVLYQPQVDIGTDCLRGVEALLRWTHPQWGPVPTDELIEAVEASEIMHMLTQHVLDSVAAQLRRWNERGDTFRASVNISVQDLHDPRFVSEIGDLIRQHRIERRQLVVEITERMLVTDAGRVKQVADGLVQQGAGLSLDDFGTGYASLRQLRELPLTEVKVDRLYVSAMADNPADAAIVTSVHQLAQALGMDVVAEGVEDQRTADALAALAGTIGQGWYFGRPMTVEELQDWRDGRPFRAAS